MSIVTPAVSILMPLRNEENYLPQAIASLRRQTFADWELVAVDDGSTDRTKSILENAAADDSRIRIFSSTGCGLVAALNHGLASCRAALVARMDGDDISHPRRLELQVDLMGRCPEVGLVACSFRHFPRHIVRSGMLGYEGWQNSLLCHEKIMADLFVESPFVHPSVMFRRVIADKIGGYRELGWPEDYDLWLRMAAAGTIFHRLPEPLFFWREREGRATRVLPAYDKDAFRACKLHHLKNGFLFDVGKITIAGAGIEGRKWGRLLAEAGITVIRWIDVDPRKVGRRLHGATVVGPDEVVPDGEKLLIAIGTAGGREGAREWALAKGLVEGKDFVCVA